MTAQTVFLKPNATSIGVDIGPILNSSTGAVLTGLVYNSAGLIGYYRRSNTGTLTSITLATQTVTGAYSSGGFVELSATNAPGMYRLDIPNAVIATGVDQIIITLSGAASMQPHTIFIPLGSVYADVSKLNSTTLNGNGAGTPWGP